VKQSAPFFLDGFSPTLLILVLIPLLILGCAPARPRTSRAPVPPPTAPPAEPAPASRPAPVSPVARGSYVEEGLSSWYGAPFHGRRAANGEVYDMYKLSAAHRTLPLNSIVRVTSLQNGRSTEVRITDRGPFIEGRILDLSLAAARELDMVSAGVVPVRIELLAGPSPFVGNFTVQVGAFLSAENAERLRERLLPRYQTVFIHQYDSPNGLFYRVRVGRVPNEDAARQLAEQLRANEDFVPFVVRLDDPGS
jgi:rare lipoprotein A